MDEYNAITPLKYYIVNLSGNGTLFGRLAEYSDAQLFVPLATGNELIKKSSSITHSSGTIESLTQKNTGSGLSPSIKYTKIQQDFDKILITSKDGSNAAHVISIEDGIINIPVRTSDWTNTSVVTKSYIDGLVGDVETLLAAI